jgi:hypothetical protein
LALTFAARSSLSSEQLVNVHQYALFTSEAIEHGCSIEANHAHSCQPTLAPRCDGTIQANPSTIQQAL